MVLIFFSILLIHIHQKILIIRIQILSKMHMMAWVRKDNPLCFKVQWESYLNVQFVNAPSTE